MKDEHENDTPRDLIEYRFTELFKRLDRIESTMNNFAFVKQSDFNEFVKETNQKFEKYVTKESQQPWHTIIISIAVTVGGAVVLAVLKFAFGGGL
ncbi:hypothetical protein ACWFRF_15395 [Nocardia sp. NPDC055165]